jgi:hypothetical protein
LTPSQLKTLASLYDEYNQTLKPLIASYEAREEKFPLPIYNEIRAFNDHVARCYHANTKPGEIDGELKKAERHIHRLVFDCFKYLNVSLNDYIRKFERQTRRVDLTKINNGEFYLKYKQLLDDAIKCVREAKKIESTNRQNAFDNYEKAFNTYCELEELIQDNLTNVSWARVFFTGKVFLKIILWLLAALISGIISARLTCDFTIKQFINSIIN